MPPELAIDGHLGGLLSLVQAAPGFRNGNYAYLASSVFFLYDWVISIDQEVQHFWKKGLSTGALLYFANRITFVSLVAVYYQTTLRPLTESQTSAICYPFLYVSIPLNAVNTVIIQVVLALRTYALWDCSLWILYPLMFLTIGGFATQMVLMALRVPKTEAIFNPLPPPYTGCVSLVGGWLYQRYIPVLAFEIPAAVLLILKFLQYVRVGRGSQIAYILYRDGFVEFAVVSISSIFALFVERYQDTSGILFTVGLNICPALAAVCCARVLLNIRDITTLSVYREGSRASGRNPPSYDDPSQTFYPGPNSPRDRRSNIIGRGNRKPHRTIDGFTQGLGFESWEMHFVSRP